MRSGLKPIWLISFRAQDRAISNADEPPSPEPGGASLRVVMFRPRRGR